MISLAQVTGGQSSNTNMVGAQFNKLSQTGNCFSVFVTWIGTATITKVQDSVNLFTQVGSTLTIGSGASAINIATFTCLSLTAGATPDIITVTFSASATAATIVPVETNGATMPIIIDAGTTGSATFTGGSDTTTPSIAGTANDPFEFILTLVATVSSVTITPRTGYTLLVNNPATNSAVLWETNSTTTGSILIKPVTLGSSVDSAIISLGLVAPLSILSGFIVAPRFPDAFAPRYADDPFDSLSSDPTFVANPYGPQPYLV
jgi:hypothetical protein